ncbi:MAG: DUF1580 domain-containing protein [Gemmataceae bacterium]|nr:DUF1580 domain-containing protein [Gemmataceae bacterium]
MTINLSTERVVPLKDYRDYHPSRRGKKLHRTSGYRHATRGIRGIKLEVIQLPSGLYTSVEAIQRFADRLTALLRKDNPPLPQTGRKADRRQAQVEREIGQVRASIRKKGGR